MDGLIDHQQFRQKYDYDPNKPLNQKGGQGVIYEGKDLETGNAIAIKRALYKGEDYERYSIISEWQRATKFNHPNLLRYYTAQRVRTDLGIYDFGVMELVEGGLNIREYFQAHKPDNKIIKEVFISILEGLSYLHTKGIIHRDIKPSNILIKIDKDGHPVPKIIDFGISKEHNNYEASVSGTIGTFAYMAPEQINPKKGDKLRPNIDLWAFGVVIFSLLVGKSPYGLPSESVNNDEIRNNILDNTMRVSIAKVPPLFRSVVERCLIRDSHQRFSTANDVIVAIEEAFLDPELEALDPVAPISPKSNDNDKIPWVKANGRLLVLLLLSIIGFAGIGYGIYHNPELVGQQPYLTSCRTEANRARCTTGALETFINTLTDHDSSNGEVEYPLQAISSRVRGEVIFDFEISDQGLMDVVVIEDELEAYDIGNQVRTYLLSFGDWQTGGLTPRGQVAHLRYTHKFSFE